MKKTISNIFYNIIYQVFLVLIPLLTVPYLSRILGPEKYGIYSTVKFTVQFLMVIAFAAMNYIGTRNIAKIHQSGSPKELNNAFWGLWYFQAIFSGIVILVMLLLIYCFKIPFSNYFIFQIPFLFAVMFDISWFFQGLSDFGKVVIRNILVKLTAVIMIFIFVKQADDVWKYMLIMSTTTLAGSLIFWMNVRKYISKPVLKLYQPKLIFSSIIALLVPQIATQIYTTLDKPILSIFQDSTQVGFYANSQRISTLILSMVTTISLVLMPKTVGMHQNQQKKYLKKSYEFSLLLGLIFTVVVMINTKEFVPFFFGNEFKPLTSLMFYSTLTIIFVPVGGVFANQFALANKRDGDYAKPVIIGAIICVITSLILDPLYGATGAMISIVLTEVLICLMRIWIVRDAIDFKYVFAETPKYLLIAMITFVIGYLLPDFVSSAFFDMTIKSLILMLIYGILFFLFKFELNQDVLNIFHKFKTRKNS